jgi:hypothetical protein
MDPLTMLSVGSTAIGALGGLFGKKKKAAEPTLTNTLTPDQQAVSSKLSQILTQGGAKYGAPRIAGMNDNEAYGQNFMRSALETARPGIERQLSGEFPEEYFNQAIADPTRRQFNDRVAPVIKENSELTGNRFADRSAIELGQARGDVESSILAERGKFGLETYRDPLNATAALTDALNNAEQLFAVPRTIEQAKLDSDFQEFLRTNPDSGGLIDAMLNFTNQGQNVATAPASEEESIFPSLFQAGTSLLGNQAMTNALQGFSGSTTSNATANTRSTTDRILQRVQRPYYTPLVGQSGV